VSTIDRRTVLKGAVAGVVGAAGASVLPVLDPLPVRAGRDYDVAPSLQVDKVVRTTCSPNCTGSCGQLAFVRDGVLV
jgi:anaerobic selenocysteine-containing dehydrogenase